jgi:hypothetical protein
VPNVPQALSNFAQAKAIFRSGQLLDAIEMAWNPSPDQPGAGQIFAIRTDTATQATFTSTSLTITSKLYGSLANSIQVELEDNATTKSKRFSVFFAPDQYNRVYDNIGNIFTVNYTGTDTLATLDITVDATTKLAKTLTLSTGTTAPLTVVKTYDLTTGVYANVDALIADIDNLTDFTASMNELGGNKNILSTYLDSQTGLDCKTAPATVTAIAADLLNQTQNDEYISVDNDFTKAFSADFPVTNLTGGTTSAPPTSWSAMFDSIQHLGAYYIIPLTSDSAVLGELSQFLSDESKAGTQMRGFVGGDSNMTVSAIKSLQASMRNDRIAVVGNSGTRTMADGRVLSFPSYMLAGLIGGLASGLPIGEPITYKHLNIDSLDQKFSGDDLDQLNSTGAVMVEFVRTRQNAYFRVVSDPTTYNDISDPVQNRISLGETSDFLTTELRTILDEEFIGTRLMNTSASILKNRVESFLDQQKKAGGLIVDYNPDDVQVIITGNTATINLSVQPAQGLDYINCYITYKDNVLTA